MNSAFSVFDDEISVAGYAIDCFCAESDGPMAGWVYCYTVGCADKGLPELVVMGKDGDEGITDLPDLLAFLANEMIDSGAALPSRFIFGGKRKSTVLVRRVGGVPRLSVTELAYRYGEARYPEKPVSFLQILVPDENGLFPGEDGIDPDYDAPML